MKKRSSKRAAVPIILVVVIAAVLVIGYTLGTTSEPEPAPPAAQEIPNEYWRCLACARIPGKRYHQCQSVTGRGNEIGARERAKARACKAVKVALDECRIVGEIKCRQLERAEAVPSRPSIEVVETPE